MSRDDDLFHAVGQRLGQRRGWSLEPSTSPGGSPSWCLQTSGHVVLGVHVDDGVIRVIVTDPDVEVEFNDVDAVIAWITLEGWTLLSG